MQNGFIKIHRKIIEWEWYDDKNVMRLFLHCLFKANWKDKQWRGKTIKRGSFITSIQHLSDETHLSIKQTRTCLGKLETGGTLIRKATNKFTLITVVNYSDYQDIPTEKDNQGANGGQSKGKPRATTKEGKEREEGEEDNRALPDFISPAVWERWIRHRTEIKKKLTPTQMESQITKLAKWHGEGYNIDDVIENSIRNGYQGLFKPKKGNGNGKRQAGNSAQEKMLTGFGFGDLE